MKPSSVDISCSHNGSSGARSLRAAGQRHTSTSTSYWWSSTFGQLAGAYLSVNSERSLFVQHYLPLGAAILHAVLSYDVLPTLKQNWKKPAQLAHHLDVHEASITIVRQRIVCCLYDTVRQQLWQPWTVNRRGVDGHIGKAFNLETALATNTSCVLVHGE